MSSLNNQQLQSFFEKSQEVRRAVAATDGPGLELPMLCVMGDTSSGKSSLLSAISGVELPSNHELTTKCPTLIHMSPSTSPDSGAVEVHEKATVAIQWEKQANEPTPGFERIKVTDLSELPQAILRAQECVLNQSYKAVASDVVTVEILSRQQHELTLMDLPGLVQTSAVNESDSLKQDIEYLIEKYLTNPNCILLAVVPANVDFHNSTILELARRMGPERTFGVITKPDLIDAGAEEPVQQLLLGNKVPLALGYHMVKGRGQAAIDSNKSLAESKAEEQAFFESVEPWLSIDDRSLFGVSELRQKLSELQCAMMKQTIPKIIKQVRQKHQTCFDSLVSMGNLNQSSGEKRRFYQDSCQTFLDSLKFSLSGRGRKSKNGKTASSAAAQLHDACSEFRNAMKEGSLGTIKSIVDGAQVLVSSAKGDVKGEVVHVENGRYACVDFVAEKDRTTDTLFDYVGYQAQEQLEEDDVWSDGSKVYIARKDNKFDLLRHIPISQIRTDPSWLKEKIAENRTDDLACFLNVDIFKSIVSDFIEADWRPHCTKLVDDTASILLQAISTCYVQSERFPKLSDLIRSHSAHAARNLVSGAETQVHKQLEIEKHPYTQDDVLLEHIAAARNANLKRDLEIALRLDQGGTQDTGTIQSLVDEVFARHQRKPPELHMAEDMEMVLAAYGTVATKRVIDRTPMICWEVFRSLCDAIQDSLWHITDVQLEDAMEDNTEYERKHNELTEELEQMNNALSVLQSLL